jgi:hypothetical protein
MGARTALGEAESTLKGLGDLDEALKSNIKMTVKPRA